MQYIYVKEDYELLARENKALANELKIPGYTDQQISNIINK